MLHSESTVEAGAASASPSTLTELLRQAEAAAANSYSPYSRFKVGAALALTSGDVVTGANVENASFGLTICAERSALVRAIAQHGPAIRLAAVAVANLNGAPSPPCGACRQMLAEFAAPDTPVSFPAVEGVVTLSLAALLPLAFTPRDLDRRALEPHDLKS
jgi:homotetrameric cytidine deaminase